MCNKGSGRGVCVLFLLILGGEFDENEPKLVLFVLALGAVDDVLCLLSGALRQWKRVIFSLFPSSESVGMVFPECQIGDWENIYSS